MIILNSDLRFQRTNFLKCVTAISHTPWWPFLQIKFHLAIFVDGHLITISTKLFSFQTAGFRAEDV